MATLAETIEPYLDEKTRLVKASDGGRGNLILYTAVLLELLPYYGRIQWHDLVDLFLAGVEDLPGLYRREADDHSPNSVDNLIGLIAASRVLRLSYHSAVFNWGQHHHWCFNVEEPERFRLRDWYGRFPGVIAFIYVAAGIPIGRVAQSLFAASCLFSLITKRSDVGNLQLQWLMNRVVYGQYPLIDRAIRLWRRLMLRRYPNGMREVFALYHGVNHPFAQFGPKDFD